jgi:hypothetical protein
MTCSAEKEVRNEPIIISPTLGLLLLGPTYKTHVHTQRILLSPMSVTNICLVCSLRRIILKCETEKYLVFCRFADPSSIACPAPGAKPPQVSNPTQGAIINM